MGPYIMRVIGRHFRTSRMMDFIRLLGITPDTTVLDIGGMESTWTQLPFLPRVTLANLTVDRAQSGKLPVVVADGRSLPYPDGYFDVVFSNSVIEHVGALSDQERFASEVMRVGRKYWVQTPNRNFPVEAHTFTPLFQFLPTRLQRAIVRRGTVRGWMEKLADWQCQELLDVKLLGPTEMRKLFPGLIHEERLLGLTKSLIAVRY